MYSRIKQLNRFTDMIQIRPSQLSDLDRLMEIFDHARNFKGRFNSLVAGFLETGETLEECVAREVKEETDIATHAKMNTEKSSEHFVLFRVPTPFIPLSKMEPG